MVRLVWDIRPMLAALDELKARLRDLRPAWRSVLAYMRRQTVIQFATQGQRSGQQWQPLSAGYARWKAVRYPGQPILRASDRMFASLLGANAEAIEEIQRQSLLYGTRVPYARYHQRGTPKMAKREMLAVTETDRREIKSLVRLHLENSSRLAGFGAVNAVNIGGTP